MAVSLDKPKEQASELLQKACHWESVAIFLIRILRNSVRMP